MYLTLSLISSTWKLHKTEIIILIGEIYIGFIFYLNTLEFAKTSVNGIIFTVSYLVNNTDYIWGVADDPVILCFYLYVY